ncbi:hypothetical protein [Bradyrhizobium sp. JR3.5]
MSPSRRFNLWPTSDDPARQIIRDVVDWYVATDEAATPESLSAQLRRTHRSLSLRFPRDSASYVLALIANAGAALVLHAGDCLLGSREQSGGVHWFTKPHTLPNPIGEVPFDEIARSPARNRLTRGFRAREFIPAEVNKITAEPGKSFLQLEFVLVYANPLLRSLNDVTEVEQFKIGLTQRCGVRGSKTALD